MLFKKWNDKIEACDVAKEYSLIVNEFMKRLGSNEKRFGHS